tara:strand:- start:1755 stop:3566 length:1812 start_codon:yes stop_codon:yes gene_type:complete
MFNTDLMDSWARYLIWVSEPLGFPLGIINGMRFPFRDAILGSNCLPLFAIPLKILTQINPVFSDIYYFVFAELVFVFFTALFSCLSLEKFGVKSFRMRLLVAVLISLSFPLLYRSSNYYGFTYQVAYTPLYLASSYFFIKMFIKPNLRSFSALILCYFVVCLFDEYTIFGCIFMLTMNSLFIFINYLFSRGKLYKKRLIFSFISVVASVIIAFSVNYSLGFRANMEATNYQNLLIDRYGDHWGYGGGYGGGFHVADVLTFFIPPTNDLELPEYKRTGPPSYLSYMGLDILSTKNLQDGQYEGFTYLGSIAFLLLLFLFLYKCYNIFINRRVFLMKQRIKFSAWNLFSLKIHFSLPTIIGLSAFFLYLISMGYIVHFGGHRIYILPTPSLIIALLYPKFILARALGRLAIPLMIVILIFVIINLNRLMNIYFERYPDNIKRNIPNFLVFIMVIFHINEIKGYLKPPNEIIWGSNEISNYFNDDESLYLKSILQNVEGIIIAPTIRNSPEWLRTSYSLALHSRKPISGIYAGIGVPEWYYKQTNYDINQILKGNIQDVIDRYGNVAISVPIEYLEDILKKTDIELKFHEFHRQNLVIILINKKEI